MVSLSYYNSIMSELWNLEKKQLVYGYWLTLNFKMFSLHRITP